MKRFFKPIEKEGRSTAAKKPYLSPEKCDEDGDGVGEVKNQKETSKFLTWNANSFLLRVKNDWSEFSKFVSDLYPDVIAVQILTRALSSLPFGNYGVWWSLADSKYEGKKCLKPQKVFFNLEKLGTFEPDNVPSHLKPQFIELKGAQFKTVSFLTYVLKSCAEYIRPHEESISNLLVTCSDAASIRKEILASLELVLGMDFKRGLFPFIDSTLLEERALIGTERACFESLRHLAYSLLMDIIHQFTRSSMSLLHQLPFFLLLLVTSPCSAATASYPEPVEPMPFVFDGVGTIFLMYQSGKPSFHFSYLWVLAVVLVVVVLCVFKMFSSKGKGSEKKCQLGEGDEQKIDTKSVRLESGSGEDGILNEQNIDSRSACHESGSEEDDIINEETNTMSTVPLNQETTKLHNVPDFLRVLQFRTAEEEDKGKMVNNKLFVSTKRVGFGSSNYEVFEGIYGRNRLVAVKCLDLSYYEDDYIMKEIDTLQDIDYHSNIIRFHGFEHDEKLGYICLEPWTCNLEDLVRLSVRKLTSKAVAPLNPLEKIMEKINLWEAVGKPSPIMLKLMSDIASALAHLHELKIIHRDLTPQNVLIIVKGMTLTAKISDMGISKHLLAESSFDHLATCYGSSKWQAPEQLRKKEENDAVDMFRFGCILFYAMTGNHPFGGVRDREDNILGNLKVNFTQVKHPEASKLINQLLNSKSNLRPTAAQVSLHPLFWDSEKRLSFLQKASDRVQHAELAISNQLKSVSITWKFLLDADLLKYIHTPQIQQGQQGQQATLFKPYKDKSVRDLLRLIRNLMSHYRELPNHIQGNLGTVPIGFERYFAKRFPTLLMTIYEVIDQHCSKEEEFQKFFKRNVVG